MGMPLMLEQKWPVFARQKRAMAGLHAQRIGMLTATAAAAGEDLR